VSAVVPNLQFQILGPIGCQWHQRRLELGGPRQLALLAQLIIHGNRTLSAEKLLEALPDARGSVAALRFAMARLTKDLEQCRTGPTGHSPLQAVDGGYKLLIGARELDAHAFMERARHGQRALDAGEPVVAAEFLRAALSMWQGPALAEVADQPFARAEATRLEESRVRAAAARLEAERRLGNHPELVPPPPRERSASVVVRPGHRLQRVVMLDPTRQLTIGRDPSSNIAIVWDMRVSRLHALLERVGEFWTLSDDGLSSNGTFCNDERVMSSRRLEDGDTIKLGDTTLVFHDPAHAEADLTLGTVVPSAAS
jgi:hypothetical protein